MTPQDTTRLRVEIPPFEDLTAQERRRVLAAAAAAARCEIVTIRRRRAEAARWAERWGAPPAAVPPETLLEAE